MTRGPLAAPAVAEPTNQRRVGWSLLANRMAAACIAACYDCALACTACARACLAEDASGLRRCIWVCQNNADVCVAVGRLLSRTPGADAEEIGSILRVCILACRMAQKECEARAGSWDTLRHTAEACRRCESECKKLVGSLAKRRSAVPSPMI
jgi:hypothetical protein